MGGAFTKLIYCVVLSIGCMCICPFYFTDDANIGGPSSHAQARGEKRSLAEAAIVSTRQAISRYSQLYCV